MGVEVHKPTTLAAPLTLVISGKIKAKQVLEASEQTNRNHRLRTTGGEHGADALKKPAVV